MPPWPNVGWRQAVVWVVLGAAAFHLAYGVPACAFLIGIYVYAACALTGVKTLRQAVYFGLGLGMAVVTPQLAFFWRIFGAGAIGLWLLVGVCIAVFTGLGWRCRKKLHPAVALLCLPVLWMGVEYTRSELHYFRFSWLTPGLAFSFSPGLWTFACLGNYGIGFVLVLAAALVLAIRRVRTRMVVGASLLLLSAGLAHGTLQAFLAPGDKAVGKTLKVAGVQMEFPYIDEALAQLTALHNQYPDTDVFVLAEYTFDHPVPAQICAWCAQHHTYLILGAVDQQAKGRYDTAFVIGPAGEVVFKQAKAVPIQLMNDGLRARSQEVWHSPWGAIGICVCYDLSYARVVNKLIRQGAQALIVPTMDVEGWGAHQHTLHAHMAPLRAAEYGVPIFRVGSSGISQLVDAHGVVQASAPFPGVHASVAGVMDLRQPGRLPIDRTLAPLGAWLTGGIILSFIAQSLAKNLVRMWKRRRTPS